MGLFDFFKNKKTVEPATTKPIETVEPEAPAQEVIQPEIKEEEEVEFTDNDKDVLLDLLAKREISILYEEEVKELPIDNKEIKKDKQDPLFYPIINFVIKSQQAYPSIIQKAYFIGVVRAVSILRYMEVLGIIGSLPARPDPAQVLLDESIFISGYFKEEDYTFKDLLGLDDYRKRLGDSFITEFSINHAELIKIRKREILEKNEILFKDVEKDIIEEEKIRIRRKHSERERKKNIQKQAIQELQEDGIIKVIHKREPIPQEVQDIVWNRDGGKCVQCGSQEKIEFDHIIPFSRGGSNTARNLQLLCEKCNRSKSNKIG